MLSFNSQYFFASLIIISKSSWLISLSISALDILFSMLFNLLLASITILLCFFFLFLVFKNLFTNPDVIENVKPQLAPIIPAGAPIAVANDAIEMMSDNIDKTFNDLSK